MKPNFNAFCPPEPIFKVGDCALYSDDVYDDIPYVQTYRDWGRLVITGSLFIPVARPREYYRAGWWYTGIIFEAPDDAMIGHNCDVGEMFHESEIRASDRGPSHGFLAYLGLLWLPTEDAANVLKISSRTLNRKRKVMDSGAHYLESKNHYIWNVGQVAKRLNISIESPEIERSNRSREVRSLNHPNHGYENIKGLFPVPIPEATPIIVPAAYDRTPPLCG